MRRGMVVNNNKNERSSLLSRASCHNRYLPDRDQHFVLHICKFYFHNITFNAIETAKSHYNNSHKSTEITYPQVQVLGFIIWNYLLF